MIDPPPLAGGEPAASFGAQAPSAVAPQSVSAAAPSVKPDSIAEKLASGDVLHAVEPATFVIFGGSGDLAHRKLLPALYNLHVDGLLPPRVAIVGVGRSVMTDEAFREFAKDGVQHFSR